MKRERLKTIGLVLLSGFVYPFIYDKIGYNFLNFIVQKTSTVFEYIKDKIVRQSANIAYEGNSYFAETLFIIIFAYLCIWLFENNFAMYKEDFSTNNNAETDDDTPVKRFLFSKPGCIFSCVLAISLASVLIFNMLTFDAATKLTNSTMQNIEIVAPYIDDIEYKKLKSSLLQMETYSDFCVIGDRLTDIATTNDLTLKNCTIYEYPQDESEN